LIKSAESFLLKLLLSEALGLTSLSFTLDSGLELNLLLLFLLLEYGSRTSKYKCGQKKGKRLNYMICFFTIATISYGIGVSGLDCLIYNFIKLQLPSKGFI
jgi:hypothetical protein